MDIAGTFKDFFEFSLDDALVQLRSIMSRLECSVCRHHVTSPIRQCKNGHLLCNGCFSEIKKTATPTCPMCRDELSEERNLSLERICEYVRYPCRSADCSVICRPGPVALLTHTGDCSFCAPVFARPFPGCLSHRSQQCSSQQRQPSPLDLVAAVGLRADFFDGTHRKQGNILAVVVVVEGERWISPPCTFTDQRPERQLSCSIQLLPSSLSRQEATAILAQSLAFNNGRSDSRTRPRFVNAYAVDAILGEDAPAINIRSAPSPRGLQMSKTTWKMATPKHLETSHIHSQNTWRFCLKVSAGIANTPGKTRIEVTFRLSQASLLETVFKMSLMQDVKLGPI